MNRRSSFLYKLSARGQWLLAVTLIAMLRLLPIDIASGIGGFLGRAIGTRSRYQKISDTQLQRALPSLSAEEREQILKRMWDNLGRVVTEYAFINKEVIRERIAIVGGQLLESIRTTGKSVVFVSGHLGNWELLSVVAHQYGMPINIIYRQPNNPYMDEVIRAQRRRFFGEMFHKTSNTAFDLVRIIKQKLPIAVLVDQKMNTGISVPFFGREAMTLTTPAELALKFELPVVAAHVRRIQGARFEVVIEAPFMLTPTGNKPQDIYDGTRRINEILERWITADPAQWFWVHRRWPKEE